MNKGDVQVDDHLAYLRDKFAHVSQLESADPSLNAPRRLEASWRRSQPATTLPGMSRPNDRLPLGGVLVGGQSRRFGSHKAAARVGDRSMVVRAVDALRPASDPVVLLGDDGTLGRRLALPWRADECRGRGPLSGLATGLRWAGELGRHGLLVLACDLPLVTSDAMTTVMSAVRPGVDAVVAGMDAPPGVQPLCGWYAAAVLGAVEEALQRGRHSVRELLGALRVERVSLSASDADTLLLNVNTPADLVRAVQRSASQNVR